MMTTQSKLITLITDGYRVEFQLVKSHFYMMVWMDEPNHPSYTTIQPTFGEAVGDIFRQIKGV